jgi:hypothetical protein
MNMNGNSFELGFVHLEDLIFHEACDFRRVRLLADQIRRDGHLKNPALVAALPGNGESFGASLNGSGKLMVLDGVNRISALKLLGFPDVLVQKVDLSDKRVKLASWDHLIFDIKKEGLIDRLKSLELDVSPCDRNRRKEVLNDEKTVCSILFRDGSSQVVSQNQPSLEERIKNLYRVIALYNSSWEIFHPGWEEGLISPFDNFEKATAINSLPVFTREQVIDLTLSGVLFPFGVTRFVVLRRVLGLEISCSVLEDKAPLSEKNLFLKELLSYRIKSKKAKFYQESVFLFNE